MKEGEQRDSAEMFVFFMFFFKQSSDLVPDGQLRNILNKSSILPAKGVLSVLAPPPHRESLPCIISWFQPIAKEEAGNWITTGRIYDNQRAALKKL